MFFLKHHQRQNSSSAPPKLWARVPVCLSLRRGDLPLRSVRTLLRFPLSSLDIRKIEVRVSHEHISIEDSFVKYLREVILRQEKTQEIIRLLHQKGTLNAPFQNKQEVTVDVKLQGKIIWEIGEDQLFSSFI